MKIAVLLPLYHDFMLPDEVVSYNHLITYLSSYEIIIVKPESLELPSHTHRKVSFPDHFFRSISGYSKLLLSSQFYESFKEYDYVLIYQLDCLVLSDNLRSFCELGYDYIGAPLFQRYKAEPIISRVGNGGLSLRKVKAFLNVLYSPRYVDEQVPFTQDFYTAHIPDLIEWPLHQRLVKKLRVLRSIRGGVTRYTSNYTMNEDLFWSDRARLFYPDFKIAPIDVALRFAFDRHPRWCFERNDLKLPFGAHAWSKWDRAFWEPYLIYGRFNLEAKN